MCIDFYEKYNVFRLQFKNFFKESEEYSCCIVIQGKIFWHEYAITQLLRKKITKTTPYWAPKESTTCSSHRLVLLKKVSF